MFFIYNSRYYEVKTPRGWFRLDEGAYQDYLEGKLWINWVPGSGNAAPAGMEQAVQRTAPVNISPRAVKLFDAAAAEGELNVLERCFPGARVNYPFKKRMAEVPIDELNLSVRSMNGLKRARIYKLGDLIEIAETPDGIKRIRNLGSKSEMEIHSVFFSACYSMLTKNEKLEFWQCVADKLDIS